MPFKQHLLRITRNLLYRLYTGTSQKFEQASRALLRSSVPGSDPVANAPQITSRKTDDRWKSLQPVWVLSTGRTGTNTLTRLLKLSPRIDAFHELSPELFQFSYDYYEKSIESSHALQTLMYLRDEPVFRSYRDGRIFVETNNRLTYIADLLAELYPGSKFIHIYRNPYDFIRSGMRRNYYNGHMRDYARIKPAAGDPHYEGWKDSSPIEKVAWNWNKVNGLCLDFMDKLPAEKKMSFSSEAFFNADPGLVNSLFNFTGSVHYRPPASDVAFVMGKKHNAQKKGQFSTPSNWTGSQVKDVNQIIAPTARRLSYELLPSRPNG